ncbi:hypothetical protein [Paenibacillus sp. YSY-4.3]
MVPRTTLVPYYGSSMRIESFFMLVGSLSIAVIYWLNLDASLL